MPFIAVFKWYGWYINVAQINLTVLPVSKYKITYIIIYIAHAMSLTSGLGKKVSSRPKLTIIIILVLTIIFSYFASSFQSDADPEAFNPDHELIMADSEAQETFGAQDYVVLVLVKDTNGNLLEMDDMKTLIDLEESMRSDSDVASAIQPTQTNPTGFASPANLLIMSFGLIQSRGDMDDMLAGINQSLWGLAQTLDDSLIDNSTKMNESIATLLPIFQNMADLQGNNGDIPAFNMTNSYAALDAISMQYGPNPVPVYLEGLRTYDVEGKKLKIAAQISQITPAITSILNHSTLLQSIVIDPINGTTSEDGLNELAQFGLPTIEAGANSLDQNIRNMYFGVLAMMTQDFQNSNGIQASGTTMYIALNSDLEDENKSKIENKIHDIAEAEERELKYGILGNQLINEEIQETMDVSQMFLLMLVFVLIVLILFLTFRSVFDTVLTIISLGMAIMWMNGITILLGYQGSIIAQVAPILLVGLGVDYGIHMIMRFREENKKGRNNKKAIAIAIATVGMALLLATITTSIGFMSNTFSSLSILKEFAIMVTIGIVSSFIIMTTFLPAVKYVVSERRERKHKEKKSKPKKEKDHSKSKFVPMVTLGAKAADRAPWAVLIILVIISSIAGYGASQLSTRFDFRDFLPTETEAYDNFVYLIDEFPFGDEENGNLYIKGDITNPRVLLAINETISRTSDDNQVLRGYPAWSIISVLNKYANPTSIFDFNQSFLVLWGQSHSDGDGLPDMNIKELYDILYDFDNSQSDMISVIHRDDEGNYDSTFISIRVNSDNLRKADVLVKELKEDAQPLMELENEGILDKVYIVGEPVVINVVITEMNEGQIRSIIITLITSFIVLTIVFFALERSIILGFITMIPVALVILWILGTMLLFGYSLNVMTITIASLTVGMGITYSIHISERFVEDLKNIENVGEACENTLTHTGMALAGAFLTTAGGFGVLYFHKLPPLQQFGVLIALSITYSFLASAYVLPTFLILWAKWHKKRDGKRQDRNMKDEGSEGMDLDPAESEEADSEGEEREDGIEEAANEKEQDKKDLEEEKVNDEED
jgi:hydrophobe/amphiphile efflux-3 (HAE3) family protein